MSGMTIEGIVTVLDVHRVTFGVDGTTGPQSLYTKCVCGWESGREEQPRNIDPEDPVRVIVRTAAFLHVGEALLEEAIVKDDL